MESTTEAATDETERTKRQAPERDYCPTPEQIRQECEAIRRERDGEKFERHRNRSRR